MNKEEYGKIIDLQLKNIPTVQAEDLLDTTDRTLLYGYTCDRDTFHVYIKNIKIHAVTYRTDYENNAPNFMEEIQVVKNDDYIPNKRLYPETCDYEFCEKLKKLGCQLPFTTWNDERPEEQFYGFTLEDRKGCGNCGVTEDSYCNGCEEYNRWFRKKLEG